MRIVAGLWAGRKLVSPAAPVRPTAEELRDMWIGLLEPELDGARVVDLFAGSGAVGLEALSRGARSCDFVENGSAALHALKANVAALKAKPDARVFKRDAIQFVQRFDKIGYDVALADPPYGSGKLDRIIADWFASPFSRVLSIEHAADHRVPGGGKSRRLADSSITVYRVG